MPKPEVAFACGSASIRSTFFSKTPKDAARLIEVVVFPTPPFWLCFLIFIILTRPSL